MKTKILIVGAALALVGEALPARADLQFVYSYQGTPVLTATPEGAFGPGDNPYLLGYLPHGGDLAAFTFNTYVGTLTVSSGFAELSAINSFSYEPPSPPPIPNTVAVTYDRGSLYIDDQIFDPSIPAEITKPFTIKWPGGHQIQIDPGETLGVVAFSWDSSQTNIIASYDEQTYGYPYSITADALTISNSSIGNIPEPSTWAMMALGFAGLGFVAYRKPRKKRARAIVV